MTWLVYMYTWNLFVLYFWPRTLQKKALSTQNKTHLDSRYIHIHIHDYVHMYIHYHALLIWACQSPMWFGNYEGQEDTIQWLKCLGRFALTMRMSKLVCNRITPASRCGHTTCRRFCSPKNLSDVFCENVLRERTTFCPRHCHFLFATWASPTSRVPGGRRKATSRHAMPRSWKLEVTYTERELEMNRTWNKSERKNA